MPLKRLAFLGLFGQENLGNDCTLEAILHHARRCQPDAELRCICSGPERVRERYGIPAVGMSAPFPIPRPGGDGVVRRILRKGLVRIPRELLHWIGAFWSLRGCQMLVAPGTGLLVDHTSGPFGFPYAVFKWSIVARLRRCRLLFVSMGAGPIYHPLSRWFIKRALSVAHFRSFRDEFSRRYIGEVGVDTGRDPVYPDLAFSLPESILPTSPRPGDEMSVIGVGVMDYRGQHNKTRLEQRGGADAVHRHYLNMVARFVAWLLEHRYTVRVLIGDVRYDSNVTDELRRLLKLRSVDVDTGLLVEDPVATTEDLLEQLAVCDVVVSPRFHNVILALMLQKPVIAMSYNEKFESLMTTTGLDAYCRHIDEVDVSWLTERLAELRGSAAGLRPHIGERTQQYRRALDEQYDAIFGDVGS